MEQLRSGMRDDAHAERRLVPMDSAEGHDNLEAHATLLGNVLAATRACLQQM